MTNIYQILFFTLLSTGLLAQNTDWTVVQEKDGVRMLSKLSTCVVPSDGMNSDYHLFKIENNTSSPKEVVWKIEKYYDGQCATCNNSEYPASKMVVPANSFVAGECGINETAALKVFVKRNHSKAQLARFSKFELSTFTIKGLL